MQENKINILFQQITTINIFRLFIITFCACYIKMQKDRCTFNQYNSLLPLSIIVSLIILSPMEVQHNPEFL